MLERIPKAMLILTAVFACFQIIGFLILFEKAEPENEQNLNNASINTISSNSELSDKIDEVEFVEKTEVNSLGVR